MRDLSQFMKSVQRRFRKIVWVAGGDLNVKLPSDGVCVGPYSTGTMAGDRGQMVLSWALSWDLCFSSTWSIVGPLSWTHEHYNFKTRSTLDYIMLSPGPATDVSDVERLYSLGWSTDHVALRCFLPLSEPSKKQRRYGRCRSEIDEKAWAQCWSAANLKGIHDSARTLMMGVEKCSKAVHNVTKHVPSELRNSFVALSSSDDQETQFAQAKRCHKLKIEWIDEVRTERFVKSALAAPRQDKSTQQKHPAAQNRRGGDGGQDHVGKGHLGFL